MANGQMENPPLSCGGGANPGRPSAPAPVLVSDRCPRVAASLHGLAVGVNQTYLTKP